jgi:hypothetical protein
MKRSKLGREIRMRWCQRGLSCPCRCSQTATLWLWKHQLHSSESASRTESITRAYCTLRLLRQPTRFDRLEIHWTLLLTLRTASCCRTLLTGSPRQPCFCQSNDSVTLYCRLALDFSDLPCL